MTSRILAITTRGLEQISAGEMDSLPGLTVDEISYRRVTAAYNGDIARLTELRTVDDVFIHLATWYGVGPHRSTLETLKIRSQHLQIEPALNLVSTFRPVSSAPSFSITANFVGKRNYNTDEIKQAVAMGITSRHRWTYTTEDVSEINIRIFIEHDRADLGLRIGGTALHRRFYKQAHVPGSLKPSVAAAMLQIAEAAPGQRVLDPFCGAGTIVIEAAAMGCQAFGGDNQAESLQAAKTNVSLSGVTVSIQAWDAQHLPIASQSADRVVTNLPWGRQVNVDENLVSFYRKISTELTRVIKDSGQIVLLTNLPQLIQTKGLVERNVIEISLFGMTPSILRLST